MHNKIYLEEVDSTNSYLLKLNQVDTICYSFNQVQGRGRHCSSWAFESSKDLAFSISFHKGKINQCIAEINLKIIYSLLQLFEQYQINANYKIPNDLYINNAKVAGILIEHLENQNQIVIGIGLNINSVNHDQLNSISMAQATNSQFNLEQVVNELSELIIKNINMNIPNLTSVLTQKNILWNQEIEFEGEIVTIGAINPDFTISLSNKKETKKIDLLNFSTKKKGV